MKIRFFYIVVVFFPLFVQAQFRYYTPAENLQHMDDRKFQWGYYFGLNQLDYHYDLKQITSTEPTLNEIQTKKSIGFNLGLSFNIRLMDHLDLRFEPGLLHNKRSVVFPGVDDRREAQRSIVSTYIYLPVLLKFSAVRWYNFKPYLVTGGSVCYNLSSIQNINIDTYEHKVFPMKQWVGHYEAGIGIDLYTPYFRVSPSVRALFGIFNEMGSHQGNLSENMKGLRTQGVLFCLTFE